MQSISASCHRGWPPGCPLLRRVRGLQCYWRSFCLRLGQEKILHSTITSNHSCCVQEESSGFHSNLIRMWFNSCLGVSLVMSFFHFKGLWVRAFYNLTKHYVKEVKMWAPGSGLCRVSAPGCWRVSVFPVWPATGSASITTPGRWPTSCSAPASCPCSPTSWRPSFWHRPQESWLGLEIVTHNT